MSTIGQYTSGMTGNYDTTTSNIAKTADSSKTSATSKSGSYGNTIGNVKLSDTAAKYYEELKNKYSGMDFVLVSDDETENAEQKAAQYANSGRTLVLIDASTVEKMATDEGVRAQYEGIIGNADAQLNEMAKSLASGVGANVKTFGIQVNSDGTTSYFAVVDKSISQQKERIEKNAEKRAEEKRRRKRKRTRNGSIKFRRRARRIELNRRKMQRRQMFRIWKPFAAHHWKN